MSQAAAPPGIADPSVKPLVVGTPVVAGEVLEPEDLRAEIRAQAELNRLQVEQLRHIVSVQKLNIRSLWLLNGAIIFVGLLGMAAGVLHVMRADLIGADYQTAYAFSLAIVLGVLFALVLISYGVYRAILRVRLRAAEIDRLLAEQLAALADAAPFIRKGYS